MSPDQGHGESVLTAADGQYPGPDLVALVPTHPASQPRTCGLSTLGRRPVALIRAGQGHGQECSQGITCDATRS